MKPGRNSLNRLLSIIITNGVRLLNQLIPAIRQKCSFPVQNRYYNLYRRQLDAEILSSLLSIYLVWLVLSLVSSRLADFYLTATGNTIALILMVGIGWNMDCFLFLVGFIYCCPLVTPGCRSPRNESDKFDPNYQQAFRDEVLAPIMKYYFRGELQQLENLPQTGHWLW